jgi:hypothetical protein
VRALLVVVALLGCSAGSKPAPAEAKMTSDVHVDRRVELLSIVCALAGFPEYTRGTVNPYRTEVVKAFAPFLSHPVIAATRALRAEHGISHDAPMILAVHLDDQLQLRNADELAVLDARWTGIDVAAYVAQLRDFATTAKLDDFLVAHAAHYAQIEDTLRAAVDAEHPIDWFDTMFGKRAHATYTVVPALMSGQYNFGVRATLADGTLQMYQLIGVDTPTGLPAVNDDLVWLLVHEMAHSYINTMLAAHKAELAGPGAKLFARVADAMKAQQYTDWTIMLNESVVRATTVVYLNDRKGTAAANAAAKAELARGFLWTVELAQGLRAYQQDRAAYPTFDAYAPKLVELLTALSSASH